MDTNRDMDYFTDFLNKLLAVLNQLAEEDAVLETRPLSIGEVDNMILIVREALFEIKKNSVMEGMYCRRANLPEYQIINLLETRTVRFFVAANDTSYLFGVDSRDNDRREAILCPGQKSRSINIIPIQRDLEQNGYNVRVYRQVKLEYVNTGQTLIREDLSTILLRFLNSPFSDINQEDFQRDMHCFVASIFESARNDLVRSCVLGNYANSSKGMMIDIDSLITIGGEWQDGKGMNDLDTVTKVVGPYRRLGVTSLSTSDKPQQVLIALA